MTDLDWNQSYVARRSIELWVRDADEFIARASALSLRHAELDAATLQVVSLFSSPRAPRAVFEEMAEWAEVSESDFEAALVALVASELLEPASDASAVDSQQQGHELPSDNGPLVLSDLVTFVELGPEQTAILHPMLEQPLVIESRLGEVLRAAGGASLTVERLAERLNIAASAAEGLRRFLASKHLLLPSGTDEVGQIREEVSASLAATGHLRRASHESATTYRLGAPLRTTDFRAPLPLSQAPAVRILVLGSCLTQFTAELLERQGPARGLAVTTLTGFPQDVDLVKQWQPDVVLLQLGAEERMLAPLWDDAPFLDADERSRRLAHIRDEVAHRLDVVADQARGCLLLVLGFSTPAISPLGMYEFRQEPSFARIVFELNETVRAALRHNPNALVIDEERMLSEVGKLRLVDDGVVPYSHHGPIDVDHGHPVPGPSRSESFDVRAPQQVVHLLADEVLDAYLAWSGIGRVKCVVVDLDRTLWPWVLGEEEPVFDDRTVASFREGAYGGIHQALKILKERGVLLATCSKNDSDDVFRHWRRLNAFADDHGLSHVLRPEDFVSHRINWQRKSVNLRSLAEQLGLGLDAFLLIDDSAIERAEVAHALPMVRVLGEVMNRVRYRLLRDPCLSASVVSPEAKRRTEMVQAQLARDQARVGFRDESSFLRSLEIQLTVHRVKPEEPLERLTELIQRTNQFNTSLVRYDSQTLAQRVASPTHSVYTLRVRDRFAAYGMVGVCLLDASTVDTLLVSCRVIGLRVALPFLASVLLHADRFPIEGSVVEGPRNHPCRGIFAEAGFDPLGEGRFQLDSRDELVSVDASVFEVCWD